MWYHTPFQIDSSQHYLLLTEKREHRTAANREIDPCLKSRNFYKELANWHLIFDKLFFFLHRFKKNLYDACLNVYIYLFRQI